MKHSILVMLMLLMFLVMSGCGKDSLQEPMTELTSFSESETEASTAESFSTDEPSSEQTQESEPNENSTIQDDEPEIPVQTADSIASEEVDQWDISTPSAQSEVKTVETEKTPVQPKPSEQSQNVSKQTEPEIVIEIPTPPAQVQPKTEPVQVTQTHETTLPSTEPEPTIPAFDIEYWITYAKNYAVSIGLKLSPAAIECWDNPMIAGPQCKYLERDIANCMDRYKNIEGFTGVWIWAEPDGKGAYKLYIGYE